MTRLERRIAAMHAPRLARTLQSALPFICFPPTVLFLTTSRRPPHAFEP